GPLLAVAGITIGFATVASSALALRFGAVRAIVMTQGLSTVFMLSLAFVPTAALAGVLYLVRSTLMNMSSPLADSLLMGIVPKEQRGLASAINSLIWRLPNSVSTILGGMLLASGSYDVPFFIAAAFYIVSITLFYRIFKNVKPKE
ncbi:MAG: MFS transporter, partial [Methanomassiliicoccales archaeon]|nr:MFS transporter [Methanomassiliicoccales archaeon]